MIRYRVCLPDDVKGQIAHLPPALKRRVRASLGFLELDPRAGKPLVRELTGLWSYAIPPHRIVYLIVSSRREIQVISFGHRRDVYDLLIQQLRGRG